YWAVVALGLGPSSPPVLGHASVRRPRAVHIRVFGHTASRPVPGLPQASAGRARRRPRAVHARFTISPSAPRRHVFSAGPRKSGVRPKGGLTPAVRDVGATVPAPPASPEIAVSAVLPADVAGAP